MPNQRRRRWREAMTVRIDLNGLLAATAGAEGVTAEELTALAPELARVRRALAERRAAGALPFADLPKRTEDLAAIVAAADAARGEFDTCVVLGIGGSALGTQALLHALGRGRRDGLRCLVSDTIDPFAFARLLEPLDLARTLFVVVSKSGDTAETMARFLIVRDRLLREMGAVDYKRHLLVVTHPTQGSLRQIVNDEGFAALPAVPDLDGRFSVLTAAGLLPAALAGIDVAELLAGAAWVDERLQATEDPLADPALALAGALWLLATRREKRIVVLMSYAERLAAAGDWFCQLWGESLGKSVDAEGRPVTLAATPVRARGSADQHSQLQLYVDGPRDKVVLFLRVEDHGETLDIPAAYQDIEEVGCLGGNALGAMLNGEQRATEAALARRGRPSATIVLPEVRPFTIGQLLALLEWTTVATALLAGIDPFGAPAIEEGKQYTFGLMGRPGYEDRRAEVERQVAMRDPRWIL
jgi:glucose-6-phosphate isomerase